MTPAGRKARERAILDVVEKQPIRTQTALVDALEDLGFAVTQATVSRDIRHLGIVKIRDDLGARYVPPGSNSPPPVTRRVLQTALREFAVWIDSGEALVAIRTQNGCANAVAVAIDKTEVTGVVATLAGDDTIFVLLRSADDRAAVLAEFQALAGS